MIIPDSNIVWLKLEDYEQLKRRSDAMANLDISDNGKYFIIMCRDHYMFSLRFVGEGSDVIEELKKTIESLDKERIYLLNKNGDLMREREKDNRDKWYNINIWRPKW